MSKQDTNKTTSVEILLDKTDRNETLDILNQLNYSMDNDGYLQSDNSAFQNYEGFFNIGSNLFLVTKHRIYKFDKNTDLEKFKRKFSEFFNKKGDHFKDLDLANFSERDELHLNLGLFVQNLKTRDNTNNIFLLDDDIIQFKTTDNFSEIKSLKSAIEFYSCEKSSESKQYWENLLRNKSNNSDTTSFINWNNSTNIDQIKIDCKRNKSLDDCIEFLKNLTIASSSVNEKSSNLSLFGNRTILSFKFADGSKRELNLKKFFKENLTHEDYEKHKTDIRILKKIKLKDDLDSLQNPKIKELLENLKSNAFDKNTLSSSENKVKSKISFFSIPRIKISRSERLPEITERLPEITERLPEIAERLPEPCLFLPVKLDSDRLNSSNDPTNQISDSPITTDTAELNPLIADFNELMNFFKNLPKTLAQISTEPLTHTNISTSIPDFWGTTITLDPNKPLILRSGPQDNLLTSFGESNDSSQNTTITHTFDPAQPLISRSRPQANLLTSFGESNDSSQNTTTTHTFNPTQPLISGPRPQANLLTSFGESNDSSQNTTTTHTFNPTQPLISGPRPQAKLLTSFGESNDSSQNTTITHTFDPAQPLISGPRPQAKLLTRAKLLSSHLENQFTRNF